MPVILTSRITSTLPLEVEGILPECCAGKSLAEIARLEVFFGKDRSALGEFFALSGACDDGELVFEGNCRSVHWIGAKMSRGAIRVEGDAGRHLGSQMSGGEIVVSGGSGDWLGAELRGGRIIVRGNAGHQVGAAYRGSVRGMRGGEIHIHGDAGNEIGARMRRGLIAVGGRSGDAPGYAMLAGTILLFGEVGKRTGGNMKRGTIVLYSRSKLELLPTFRWGGRLPNCFLPVLYRNLRQQGFPLAEGITAEFDFYSGDMLEGGRGEILVAAR
jgi:formylmethanofuran dehydrogenase subunit C